MRFNQPAYPTVYFSDEIWVKCPKCNELALVETELGKYNIPFPTGYKTKLECKNCNFLKSDNIEWYGYYRATLRRACGFCGSYISYASAPTKTPYEKAGVRCDTCKKEKEYELKWYRFKDDKPTDPFFGLELWMQIEIKSNTLWLYNLDHLNYLREYVQAKLREDDSRHKYSMITNLPQWVKTAKNRDLIVKKLNKLESNFIKLLPK